MRTHTIHVHVTEGEKAAVDRVADAEGMSLSTYVRRLIRHDLAQRHAELQVTPA